jgi:hypothetical protein
MCSSAFASVAIRKDGVSEGVATTLDFTSDGSGYSTDGSTYNMPINLDFLATGVNKGDATTLPTTAADAQTPSYRIARVWITTRTLTFANGYPGQLLTLVAEPNSDTGTLTIDATTQFGWSSISMDTVGDTVTLLYVDDTLGWTVAAAQGVTINP